MAPHRSRLVLHSSREQVLNRPDAGLSQSSSHSMRESLAGLIVVMLARSASAFRIASRLTTAAPRLPTAATRLPTRTLVRAMADEANEGSVTGVRALSLSPRAGARARARAR